MYRPDDETENENEKKIPEETESNPEEEQTQPAEQQSFDFSVDDEKPTQDENAFAYDGDRPAEPESRTYYDGYGEPAGSHGRTEKPKKQKDENLYMSKKAVGWIVALCLVVSVVCGVCADAIAGAIRSGKDSTTSPNSIIAESNQPLGSAGSTSTTATQGIVPISTVDAKNIPTVAIASGGVRFSSYADVIERCINSVVQIEVTEETYSSLYGMAYETAGAGSGVIYTTDGYIVTNYHVVGASTKSITVILYDGTEYEGAFVCGDESMDISVIKINKNDCVAAKIGSSSDMRLGEDVIAIGNPLGYGITVSEGIISASSRKVTVENTTMTLMQTTAAINSGSSGGGLFNMKGELVGITNAKVGGTSVEAMGYAIPSERVVKCINDFSKYGYVTGIARLGISANANGIVYGGYSFIGYGIQVLGVKEGSTAALAGIQVDDIIHSIDGTVCSSFSVLTELLTKYKVGDTITVDIRRPTVEKSNRTSFYTYYDMCEIIEMQVTFVEFNPDN